MTKLFGAVCRLLLLGGLTFVFVVLYGYGFSGFSQGAAADWNDFLTFLPNAPGNVADTVSRLINPPPEPTPTPVPTVTPSPTMDKLLRQQPTDINAPISIYPSSSPNGH